jgi:uncharacterized protein DUF4357
MVPSAFTIKILVPEGIPDGLRIIEKSNWIGLCVICPRARYSHVKSREEFSRSGVYILVGYSGDDDRPTLYIGEGETIRPRLDSHHEHKDFWQQAIIFTTKGDALNKAQVRYLEAALVELADRNRRCQLDNANAPSQPGLSEADEAEIAGYLDEMLSLMPIIGIDAFDRVPHVHSADHAAPAESPDIPAAAVSKPPAIDADQPERRIYYLSAKDCRACGFETNTGFAVCKGSLARGKAVNSLENHNPGSFKKRKQLIEEGVLVMDNDSYRFTIDYVFRNPSLAGDVCAGAAVNAPKDWRDVDEVSLKEHQAQEAKV